MDDFPRCSHGGHPRHCIWCNPAPPSHPTTLGPVFIEDDRRTLVLRDGLACGTLLDWQARCRAAEALLCATLPRCSGDHEIAGGRCEQFAARRDFSGAFVCAEHDTSDPTENEGHDIAHAKELAAWLAAGGAR